jgi:hypothetical protein
MLTRAIMMVLVIANALSSRAIGQCDDLRSASVEQATSYIEHAPDDAASAKCVQIAFDVIGSLPTEQAVPVLLKYLGYKRPLNDSEQHGFFMHGNVRWRTWMSKVDREWRPMPAFPVNQGGHLP